jgi:hypothetical protein
MCAQESSLHTNHIKNGYEITNVTNILFIIQILSYIILNRTLSKIQQRKDTITPQAIDRG